jgi:hypothetical protein
MCQSRQGHKPLDIRALLQEADSANAAVPGFNTSVAHPSTTLTTVVAKVSEMNAGGPFVLLVFAMVLSILGWVAFWLSPKRFISLSLGIFFLTMGLGVGAAAWLHASAEGLKKLLDSIDHRYVQDAKIGSVFMGLLWSVASGLILSFLSAAIAMWVELETGRYGILNQVASKEVELELHSSRQE